jgi:hypothetical protein
MRLEPEFDFLLIIKSAKSIREFAELEETEAASSLFPWIIMPLQLQR